MLGAVVSTTVSVALHVELLPAASVTVMVIVESPIAAVAPATGDCVNCSAFATVQLSLATTPAVKSGTSAVQLLVAESVWFAAQLVMLGTVVSLTVKVAVQVTVLLASSVAVSVTVVTPVVTAVPAAGDCVITIDESQLSAATAFAVKSGTDALQLESAEADWFGAQVVKVGAVTSFTVKLTGQVMLLPASSATVMVIVEAPRAAIEPAAGDCVTVKLLSQLSAATTKVVTSGTKPWQLASAFTVCAGAQVVMLGAVVSATVKVVVQVVVLPAASATVIVTVVAPRAATSFAAGDCVIVRDELQLSLAMTPAVKSGTKAVQVAPALSV